MVPRVQDLVKVEIGQQGRDRRSLRGPSLYRFPLVLFDDSRPEPLQDKPKQSAIRDPVLEKPLYRLVADVVKKPRVIGTLLSTSSASGKTHWVFRILFSGFADNTDPSDSPCPCIPTVWLLAFEGRSIRTSAGCRRLRENRGKPPV